LFDDVNILPFVDDNTVLQKTFKQLRRPNEPVEDVHVPAERFKQDTSNSFVITTGLVQSADLLKKDYVISTTSLQAAVTSYSNQLTMHHTLY
jgi:hypothetical protein